MNITLTTRHCEIDSETARRARERVTRLQRFESRLTTAELTFQEERHTKRVEGVVTVSGSPNVVAHGEGDGFTEALDQVVERLERILTKRRNRRRDHRGPGTRNLPQLDSV